MEIRLIKSEHDYREALAELDKYFDATVGSKESDYADVLALLVDEYEKTHYPIESPDPIEAIKIRMEEMQLKQKDLAPAIGGKNRVSEVLSKKRKLTLEMIRNLTVKLKISPEILIKDYQLIQ
jgi:HTH-type transcriptional regulator / antitoxin HigA